MPKSHAEELDKKWNLQYEKLVDFNRKYGHCRVKHHYKPDKIFGTWVATQSRSKSQKHMSCHRKDLLNKLGFVWGSQSEYWNQQYEKLVEYQTKNGDCRVPQVYKQDRAFGVWVSTQRGSYTTKRMRPDRMKLLDEIGFIRDLKWKWKKQYAKLVKFKQKHGHCRVPFRYKEDLALSLWVDIQRNDHGNNEIPQNRKDLLNKLGFVWSKVNNLAASSCVTDKNSVSAAATGSVGLSSEKLEEEEKEPARGHVRNRFECPSPVNRKRPRTRSRCLAESGQIMDARTNESRSFVEKDDDGHDEEDSSPSLVTSHSTVLRISCDPDQEAVQADQEAVQEEAAAAPDAYLPPGWTCMKLEPDF